MDPVGVVRDGGISAAEEEEVVGGFQCGADAEANVLVARLWGEVGGTPGTKNGAAESATPS